MENFFNLLLSDMTTEEICQRLLSEHPLECEVLYKQGDLPYGVYKGAIPEKSPVTIFMDYSLSYDDVEIYPAFIDFLREKMQEAPVPRENMRNFCMRKYV